MLQFLQRIGKAVMLPIAALPIAGILLGVGGAFLGIAGLENAPAIYQPLLAFISIPAVHAVLTVMKNIGDIVFGNLRIYSHFICRLSELYPIGVCRCLCDCRNSVSSGYRSLDADCL